MRKQGGFTLIEIVMVLVLLGILSAVAVPKYFDLRDQAEAQAAKAFVAEYQSRLNAKFAMEILKNTNSCSQAYDLAVQEAIKINNDTGAAYNITVEAPAATTGGMVQATVKSVKTGNTLGTDYVVSFPTCGSTTPASSGN